MADLLSAAGTAVGIVSLGLQVSQGLITYYSHFKAHDEEIAYIVRKSEALQQLLQALEGPLKKAESGSGEVSKQVRGFVVACEAGLEILLVAAEKYGSSSIPSTREDKTRALQKRTLYPFKRGTLEELNGTLLELTANLQLALQLLTLETSQTHQDALTQTMSTSIQHSSTHFEVLSTKMDQLTLSVQSAQVHSHLCKEPALLASKRQELQHLEVEWAEYLETKTRRRRQLSKLKNSTCSCRYSPQTSERHLYLYGLSSFWSRSVQHLPSCPLSRYAQQRVDTIGVKYTYCTKILGYSIAATFSATRGPGGLAISPQLTLRAVVPDDSPAFSLLELMNDNYHRHNRRIPNLMDRAEWVLQQLTLLFNEGKASPMDVTQDGNTLLHYALYTFMGRSCYLSEQIQAVFFLLEGIIKFGADPLQRDPWDKTLADAALFQLTTTSIQDFEPHMDHIIDLMAKLFENGLAVEEISDQWFQASKVVTIVQMTMKRLTPENRLGTLEVSDVLNAILCQDEIALQKAVARFPEQVKESHQSGRTPLHFAVTWPEGTVILLKGGADINAYDCHGHTPLWHACQSGSFLAASLLLDHDSSVGGLWDQNDVLDQGCCGQYDNVALQEKFILHLVDRRKRLWDLALEQLPRFEFGKLGLHDDRILDAQACAVSSALLEHGIEIEPALMPSLEPRRTTVYHASELDTSTANMLFEAGFRDIDELDHKDLTPFWYHILGDEIFFERLELLKWLQGKGANVYRQYPKHGGMAMHGLGAAIGTFFLNSTEKGKTKPLTGEEASITAPFLQDDATDNCLCACSKTGCRVITAALKYCRNWWEHFQLPNVEWSRKDLSLPVCILILQLVEAGNGENPWMPFEVIRVMTFEWLELTHTCHRDPISRDYGPRGLLSKDEIHEIREEERYLLAQHEKLVSRFETKFIDLGLPLTKFLEEHWAPAMIEVLEEDQTGNVEEEQKMRELGVVVDEQDRFREVESDEEDLGQEDCTMEGVDSDIEPFHDCEDPTGES